ncbi:MAG: hypothetical protein J0647_03965 [Campylobacteraceae bacterium]|nr:hypothetical protein [Campylobacteraceae bacterium]
MNLLINSKFIRLLWWILAPLLVAKLLISLSLFFLDTQPLQPLHVKSEKITKAYRFPDFFDANSLNQKTEQNSIKVEKFGNMVLKACYIEKNKAFIVVDENKKSLFLNLDESYKGAKLVEITVNSATFFKDSEYINLVLDKKTNELEIAEIDNDISIKEKTEETTDAKISTIKRDNLAKYTHNMNEVLKDIKVQEMTENNEFAGVQLSFIKKGSLFDEMGFEKDDIIKSVDNKKLNNIMDLLPYYNALKSTTSLKIGIERNLELKEITYEIN